MKLILLGLLVVMSQTATAIPETRGEKPVADLGTRRAGADWPGFLGPQGNSKSAEVGILTDWPPEGPPTLWQCPLGEGYAMPSIDLDRW